MTRWWARASIALAVVAGGSSTATAGPAPYVTARAAIVMDAATGEVIWERNASEPLPPASTTKVMTAVVALESGQIDETFRVSAAAADTAPSRINLRAGQRMRLDNLLYAVLLNSANDAAEVVAEGVAGSRGAFAEKMTARAQRLGARTAIFMNPHGLTAPGHVASARDLAVIFRHALGLPLFRDILETPSARVPVESAGVRWVSLRSHNRLLTGHTYRVIGKTGYTRAAGRCFVGAARRDGREVIVAVLGSRDLWGDTRRLVGHGFGDATEPAPVVMAKAGRRSTARAARSAEGDDDPPTDPRIARFTVRVGPYGSRAAALSARSRLGRRGFNARLAGRSLHVGSFSSTSRAERIATRLRQSGYPTTVVML